MNKNIKQKLIIILFLTLITIISYGQMIQMNFWQDDNAVVFKFTHINEAAGYLGKGMFGEGAYRYTMASYFPVFSLFGYEPVFYFSFALFFLLLSVYVVYFFFLSVFENKIKASIAGFLYAAGYVASDGFIRMFNSVLTSLSVIFVCGTVGFYYRYFKTHKIYFYFLSLLFYFLAVDIGYIRTHFLFFVIVALEFLFSVKLFSIKIAVKSFFKSLVRLTPFAILFYKYFLFEADNRSNQVTLLVKSILNGDFYNSYSFFSSLGNIFLSNEIFPDLYNRFGTISGLALTDGKIILFLLIIFIIILILLVWKKILSFRFSIFIIFILTLFLFQAKKVFLYPGFVGGINEKVSLYTAIVFIFLTLIFLKILPCKKLTLLFFIWMALNMAAYGAYIPIYAYASDNRYLLQSFIPIIGLLSLWSYELYKKLRPSFYAYLPILLIIIWGFINLFSAVSCQQKIITHRSNPSKRFFKELKKYVPSFEKGSIFYFYVPDKPFAKTHYDNGFSVAQMPEETAIAWRYGLDRYDFKIVNTFNDLQAEIIKNKVPITKIFAFIADPDKLIDVTFQTRYLLKNSFYSTNQVFMDSELNIKKSIENSEINMKPIMIYPENISTLTSIKTSITISGKPLNGANLKFPVHMIKGIDNIGKDSNIIGEKDRLHYLKYREWQTYFYQNTKISATTSWKSNTPNLLFDRNKDTYWEADRVIWDDHNQGIIIDLGRTISIGGIYYINGPRSLIPTKFEILVSENNEDYIKVKNVEIDTSKEENVQKIIFEKKDARYVKIMFHKTLYDDAPGISEIGVFPAEFSDIDIVLAENFYRNPFLKVNSLLEWEDLMANFYDKGLIRISWKTDATNKIQTTAESTLPIIYNGNNQIINVEIPAGGQKLEYLEISPITIPGIISISNIVYENLVIINK